MTQPLRPGWWQEPEGPKRAFRVSQADVERSRKRGSSRGARSRFALRSLPPIDVDNPECFEEES